MRCAVTRYDLRCFRSTSINAKGTTLLEDMPRTICNENELGFGNEEGKRRKHNRSCGTWEHDATHAETPPQTLVAETENAVHRDLQQGLRNHRAALPEQKEHLMHRCVKHAYVHVWTDARMRGCSDI